MERPVMTREQLDECLMSTVSPDEKGWNIYRHLKASSGASLSSADYRRLLLKYLELGVTRQSLLHSLMLTLVLKNADAYPDFRLPPFVDMWGVENLRAEDFNRYTGENGRTSHSLAERLAVAILRYVTAHTDCPISDATMRLALSQGEKLGYLSPRPMAAVKMFESERAGRKLRMVKLVGADGTELSADSRTFHVKPWEVVGNVFQVLPRRAEKSGNVRIDTIGLSQQSAGDVFGSIVGYVDSYDEKHKHYHIFDNTSRHFVAESPKLHINVGQYVRFAPIVPADDPFKVAIVLAVESKEAGRTAFGPISAKVEYINVEKGYFAYTTGSQQRAFAKLKSAASPLKPDDTVNLIIYHRRGPDGVKRPFVADTFI